jgi:hypothetical protein
VQELDEEEDRRLVGSILEDEDEKGCTMLDLDEDTMTTVKPVVEDDTTSGAEGSSIWEDGERLWTSNTPPPPERERYQPLASSPLATPILPTPTNKMNKAKKREFEVAKDTSLSPSPKQEDAPNSSPSSKKSTAVMTGVCATG